ncbi:hypothetical protein GCM10007968_30680 [Sporolactobacillus putidus]|uniref:Uncharacterized protein n=1 Tax=Sporolactobacillus putidus TaxID=492735 RepID=A0A917W5D5_9BACL|nr:hypothetical protein GCM10007968_30680 [Sporolactobacillus putidus]
MIEATFDFVFMMQKRECNIGFSQFFMDELKVQRLSSQCFQRFLREEKFLNPISALIYFWG